MLTWALRFAPMQAGLLTCVAMDAVFLLQDFYVAAHAQNFLMHILVRDVQAWYDKVCNANLAEKYQVRVTPIKTQPYFMRDFTVSDPSGVCWLIGENILGGPHV